MKKDKTTVTEELIALNYFQYSETIQTTIEDTFKDYQNDGEINFPWEGLNRILGVDSESIYEAGGLESYVDGLVDLFRKLGIKLEVGQCIEEFDNNSSTYTKREIVINGKTYSTPNVTEWGSAFNSAFYLTNQLLKENNFNGKVYGLFMDESSTLIILNNDQYEYLVELIPEGATYRPIDLSKMMKEHYGK